MNRHGAFLVAGLLAALAVALPATSSDPLLEEFAEGECLDLGVPAPACGLVGDASEALERAGGGASVGVCDAAASQCDLDVANFYFSPRILRVADGQTLRWVNDNPPGGNRHSVISSDIGGNQPVLPIFVGDTGGGKAFKSGELQPGDPFQITLNIATMPTDGYTVLPTGDFLIKYHCYIHGSSQMNGFLLVEG